MFFDVLIYFSGYKVYNESADYITVCKYSLYDSLLWIKQTEGVEAKFTDHLTTNKQTIRAYNLLKYLKKKQKKESSADQSDFMLLFDNEESFSLDVKVSRVQQSLQRDQADNLRADHRQV